LLHDVGDEIRISDKSGIRGGPFVEMGDFPCVWLLSKEISIRRRLHIGSAAASRKSAESQAGYQSPAALPMSVDRIGIPPNLASRISQSKVRNPMYVAPKRKQPLLLLHEQDVGALPKQGPFLVTDSIDCARVPLAEARERVAKRFRTRLQREVEFMLIQVCKMKMRSALSERHGQ
jgi:hypothetical protein